MDRQRASVRHITSRRHPKVQTFRRRLPPRWNGLGVDRMEGESGHDDTAERKKATEAGRSKSQPMKAIPVRLTRGCFWAGVDTDREHERRRNVTGVAP